MLRYVRVIGFCFNVNLGLTKDKQYRLQTNSQGEDYVIDDLGRANYSIFNCCKTEGE